MVPGCMWFIICSFPISPALTVGSQMIAGLWAQTLSPYGPQRWFLYVGGSLAVAFQFPGARLQFLAV